VFGGARIGNGTFVDVNDTWEWDGSRWRAISAGGAQPSARRAHALGYDPNEQRVLLIGGVRMNPGSTNDEALDDSWTYDGRRWERGPEIPPMSHHRLVYDAARRSMLLLGHAGRETPAPQRLVIRRRSPNGWVFVDSTGPLGSTDAAYDAKRSVLVVPVLKDSISQVWEWNDARWTVTHAPGPSRRSRYALAYDQRAGVVVLFGGRDDRTRDALGDAWAWDGVRWSQLDAGDQAPNPRASASLVADVRSDRLLLYGGSTSRGVVTDIWIWSRARWAHWRPGPD
jgi:hypothetical protein